MWPHPHRRRTIPPSWTAWPEGRLWTLTYAEDAAIHISCRAGSGRIAIWESVHEGRVIRSVGLVSGEVHKTYPVTFRGDYTIGWMAERRTTVRDPVMREFARTGRLRYSDSDPMEARTPAVKAQVATFFRGCGQTR